MQDTIQDTIQDTKDERLPETTANDPNEPPKRKRGGPGRGRGRDCDMTKGNIWALLIRFSLPLLVGYLFQQLYNTVDLFVVGHYVNDAAYAAVGSIGPIINTLIGFFMGLSAGAGVLISQYYGAGDEENLSKAVHTTMALTLVMTVLFTVGGILLSPWMLRLMHMEGDIYDEGKTYLVIYFAGVIGLMFYNTGSGILRAVGDSRRPFIFLVVTAVLNTVLDLVFAIQLQDRISGVAGVALATVISQIVSAVLCVIVLMRARGCAYRFSFAKMRFDGAHLKKIFIVGIPSALQMAITAFSNVFVQSYVVDLGPDVLGGWTSYAKIDAFGMLPMQSIAMAATTFVGQNLGAGDLKRAKRGTRISLLLSLIISGITLIPLMLWADPIVAVFNDSPGIVHYGAIILRIIAPFNLLCCFNQIYAGVLRGAGDTRAPMFIMLFSFVLVRQIYLLIVKHVSYTVTLVALGYPVGWAICSLLCFLYYRFAHWEKHKLTTAEMKG